MRHSLHSGLPAYLLTVILGATSVSRGQQVEAAARGASEAVTGGAVIVRSANEPSEPLIWQRFRIVPRRGGGPTVPRSEPAAPQSPESAWRAALDPYGVSWPTGSELRLAASGDDLQVCNTRANLDAIGDAIKDMLLVPYQIEVVAHFAAFQNEAIARLGLDGVTAVSLLGLLTNEQARVLASPRALADSGQECLVKDVRACTYPTAFKVVNAASTNAGADVRAVLTVEPQSFTTRETGVQLRVLADASPNGSIELLVIPRHTDLQVWEDFGSTYTDSQGHTQTLRMPQPVFRTLDASTLVTLADGGYVLIGGTPTPDGKETIYTIIGARLLGLDGRPLRNGTRLPGR